MSQTEWLSIICWFNIVDLLMLACLSDEPSRPRCIRQKLLSTYLLKDLADFHHHRCHAVPWIGLGRLWSAIQMMTSQSSQWKGWTKLRHPAKDSRLEAVAPDDIPRHMCHTQKVPEEFADFWSTHTPHSRLAFSGKTWQQWKVQFTFNTHVQIFAALRPMFPPRHSRYTDHWNDEWKQLSA